MSKSTPLLALVAAFATASVQATPESEDNQRRETRRAAVHQQLQAVQVELYCDHPAQALHLIRDTRRQLMSQRDDESERGVRQLDRASWLVRHGDTVEAIAALEDTPRAT